ncbi:MAG TPA: ATP-binding protein [Pyrinomonadaceae bacterium]|nr:ATP-binding protein [Pyrinomonadaceae bacterium]
MNSQKKIKKHWEKNFYQTDLILQSIAEGICVIDLNGEISFTNRAAKSLLGFELKELIGLNYEETLFDRAKNEVEFCPIRFALTDGETSHVNTETFFRADKSSFLVEYICVPLVEKNEIIGAVLTFEDITERREIENALAEARDEALKNAQIKAVFLANMSHEIRTPLHGIIGTTNLLAETDLDENQKKYSEMLKTSADLLLEIINDILDFSKIEAGKLTLETVEFDLRKTVSEVCEVFKILAQRKNLKLNFDVEKQIPRTIFGDSGQLKQVLNNLLSNAVKFTEKGKIRLKVSLKEEKADKIILFFEVSDSGIGIDENSQNQIFQPFTQADASTTRRFGGTGLGLTICREIVEKMNGKIGVESEKKNGSRFWFTAELVKFQEISNVEIKELNENIEAEKNRKNIKILVAEDNEINREVVLAMLKSLGFEAETAENGVEVLEMCFEKDFDLVLMDCQMPKIDGLAAAKAIRESKKITKQPKIIALTASSSLEERRKCFDAGMDDFLTKPLEKIKLTETLNKYYFSGNPLQNLDLSDKFSQHSLAEFIAPETLKNFLEIEANGEKNFTFEMISLFCRNAESGIFEIKEALKSQNAELIRRKAHQLKGSSANVGAMKLAKNFENLENEIQNENWTESENLLDQIFKEIELLSKAIS